MKQDKLNRQVGPADEQAEDEARDRQRPQMIDLAEKKPVMRMGQWVCECAHHAWDAPICGCRERMTFCECPRCIQVETPANFRPPGVHG